MTVPYRRTGGLAIAAILAASGVAGCSGSKPPQVASLQKTGGSSGSSTTTTLPKGNPTQLLDEWASCMRANGVPDMADPTITASGAIDITLPADASGDSVGKQTFGGTDGPCGSYLTAASLALNGGKPPQRPNAAKVLKYSQCMQSHGFPQFPDPSPGGGLQISIQPGSTMTPNNPAFINTSKMCSQKTGVPGLGNPGSAPRGAIMVHGGSGPSGGPGGNGGSGAVVGNVGGPSAGNGGLSSGGLNTSSGGSGG